MRQGAIHRVVLVCAVLVLGACLAAVTLPAAARAAIYWQGNGAHGSVEIGRSNLDGSNADPTFMDLTDLPAPGGGFASCGPVAVDAGHIYWADNARGTIGRSNVDGTDANDFFITGATGPCGLAVDSSHIYWTNGESAAAGFIGRAKIDGTEVEQHFLDVGFGFFTLTRSSTALFWEDSGSIGRAQGEDSESPETFLPSVHAGCCGLVVAGDHIYWTVSANEGSIGRARLDGEDVELEFIPGLLRPCGIAAHDGFLYWTEKEPPVSRAGGAISRARIDGSDLQRYIVPRIEDGACGIAVDDRVAPPLPEPGRLSIGRIRHNVRKGIVFVALKVSGPGTLGVNVREGIHVRSLGWESEVAAGSYWLKLSVGPGSPSAWPRKLLRREGRAAFTLTAHYVPTTGQPQSKGKNALLVRKPQRHHKRMSGHRHGSTVHQ